MFVNIGILFTKFEGFIKNNMFRLGFIFLPTLQKVYVVIRISDYYCRHFLLNIKLPEIFTFYIVLSEFILVSFVVSLDEITSEMVSFNVDRIHFRICIMIYSYTDHYPFEY